MTQATFWVRLARRWQRHVVQEALLESPNLNPQSAAEVDTGFKPALCLEDLKDVCNLLVGSIGEEIEKMKLALEEYVEPTLRRS